MLFSLAKGCLPDAGQRGPGIAQSGMGNSVQSFYGRDTLRYVRLMLLVVPLLLVVAIIVYGVVNQRIESSISSYYLGPARDLFVAMLVTTGVLLVVYSGPPLEDLSLNLAGFYAMFVALVPTKLGQTLQELSQGERVKLVLSVRVAIIAILVVTAVFAWLGWRTKRWPRREFMHNLPTTVLTLIGVVLLTGFLVLLTWRTIEGAEFAGVHASAAALMIGSMGIAIASHVGPARLCPGGGAGERSWHYAVLVGLMAAGLFAWPVLEALGISQALFIVEWFEIGLFSYFWYLESRRLWHEPERTAPILG